METQLEKLVITLSGNKTNKADKEKLVQEFCECLLKDLREIDTTSFNGSEITTRIEKLSRENGIPQRILRMYF